MPTVAARLFLPDIACRFLKLYPEIELEIVAEDTFIDVLAAGFDAEASVMTSASSAT